MGDRIFFKDKTNALKGPFTERQIQEWYRKKWFENSFPFYFTRSDDCPSDEENSGITLDSLRYLNGFGCPFFKVDEKEEREFEKKRRDREEKLESIEKEIAELRQQCDAVIWLEKTIEKLEMKMEDLVMLILKEKTSIQTEKDTQKDVKTAIFRPDSIPANIWQQFYDLGSSVADFVLDGFTLSAMSKEVEWDKNRAKIIVSALDQVKGEDEQSRRDLVCEYILIEKMKEKEFLCCQICQETLFNYKQTIIHFFSQGHFNRARAAGLCSIIIHDVQKVMNLITPLLVKSGDVEIGFWKQQRINGYVYNEENRPTSDWADYFYRRYPGLAMLREDFLTSEELSLMSSDPLLADSMSLIRVAKTEKGRKAMDELHEYIGDAQTHCSYCQINTGDRNGYYAHLLSYFHVNISTTTLKEAKSFRFCNFTLLVNVHKKDLI